MEHVLHCQRNSNDLTQKINDKVLYIILLTNHYDQRLNSCTLKCVLSALRWNFFVIHLQYTLTMLSVIFDDNNCYNKFKIHETSKIGLPRCRNASYVHNLTTNFFLVLQVEGLVESTINKGIEVVEKTADEKMAEASSEMDKKMDEADKFLDSKREDLTKTVQEGASKVNETSASVQNSLLGKAKGFLKCKHNLLTYLLCK